MRLRWLCLVMSAAVLAEAPVYAAPVYYGYTSASSHAVNSSGPLASDEFNGAVPDGSISYSGANAAGIIEPAGAWSVGSQSTGTATVNTGGIHLTAAGSSTVVNSSGLISGNAFGYATGRFIDSFTLTATGCSPAVQCYSGANGTMKVALNVNGLLTANGEINSAGSLTDGGWHSYGNWAASMSLQGSGTGSASWSGGQRYESYTEDSYLTGYNVAYPFASYGSHTIDVPVIFGNTVSVNIFGVVGAYGLASSDSRFTSNAVGGATANLGNTISWGGILGLYDSAGNPITDFTALSLDTGFDYRNSYARDVSAVPLPPAILLFVSGLSLMAASRVRRKSS